MDRDRGERAEAERRIDRRLDGDAGVSEATAALQAVAHETRLCLLVVLAARGATRTATLTDAVPAHPSDVYYHLETLADAGLAAPVPDAAAKTYRPTAAGEAFTEELLAAVERLVPVDDGG